MSLFIRAIRLFLLSIELTIVIHKGITLRRTRSLTERSALGYWELGDKGPRKTALETTKEISLITKNAYAELVDATFNSVRMRLPGRLETEPPSRFSTLIYA
jgi:hypothetical protein